MFFVYFCLNIPQPNLLKMLYRCLIVVSFLFLLLCCKDQKNGNENLKNSWIVTKGVAAEPVDINNRGHASTDVYSQESACGLDDIYTFKNNNILMVDNNEAICNDEPKMMEGTYKLDNDSLIINNPPRVPLRCKIVSLNEQEMVLRINLDYKPGGVDVTYTFSRIE